MEGWREERGERVRGREKKSSAAQWPEVRQGSFEVTFLRERGRERERGRVYFHWV